LTIHLMEGNLWKGKQIKRIGSHEQKNKRCRRRRRESTTKDWQACRKKDGNSGDPRPYL